MPKMKIRIGEVSFEDRIDNYAVVARDNIEARGLLVKHLGDQSHWQSIRVRDTPNVDDGPARVIGQISAEE